MEMSEKTRWSNCIADMELATDKDRGPAGTMQTVNEARYTFWHTVIDIWQASGQPKDELMIYWKK